MIMHLDCYALYSLKQFFVEYCAPIGILKIYEKCPIIGCPL